MIGLLASTSRLMAEQGLIGFDTMKALSIAEATINAYQAATKAWSQGGIYGGAMAAITLAGAMAQVYKIQKTQPPKREKGGAVSRGSSFLVGERGAELFTPNQSGNITSNDKIGGNTNIIFKIEANDSKGFDTLLTKRRGLIMSMISKSLSQAGRPQANIFAGAS